MIFQLKGTPEFCISTSKFIFFYNMDESGIPDLQNVMANYMGCSQTMFGHSKKSAITYKVNENSFEIFQRKFLHNLRICVNSQNMEGAKAIEVASMGKIFVTNVNVIDVFSNKTFRKLFTIPIPLLKDEAREPNEIIGIQGSPDEKWIAIVTGKNLSVLFRLSSVGKQN